jgi:hypothetical protein
MVQDYAKEEYKAKKKDEGTKHDGRDDSKVNRSFEPELRCVQILLFTDPIAEFHAVLRSIPPR